MTIPGGTVRAHALGEQRTALGQFDAMLPSSARALRPRYLQFMHEACEAHGVDVDMVLVRRVKTRIQRVVFARQECFWRLRKLTEMSYETIGNKFGYDRTTVRHGCRAHQKRIEDARRLIQRTEADEEACARREHGSGAGAVEPGGVPTGSGGAGDANPA